MLGGQSLEAAIGTQERLNVSFSSYWEGRPCCLRPRAEAEWKVAAGSENRVGVLRLVRPRLGATSCELSVIRQEGERGKKRWRLGWVRASVSFSSAGGVPNRVAGPVPRAEDHDERRLPGEPLSRPRGHPGMRETFLKIRSRRQATAIWIGDTLECCGQWREFCCSGRSVMLVSTFQAFANGRLVGEVERR